MKLKDLKEFNYEQVGKIETKMWIAYYRHNFLRLFFLLIHLIREQFGMNYFKAFIAGYYSASAAIIFRLGRGKENKEKIVKNLINIHKILSDNALEKFDYVKAGELEFEWWMIDRYPERYQVTRRDALKNSMACVFNVESNKLGEYANYRAEAMELQDTAEAENKKEADWSKVQSLLILSYKSLYETLHQV